MPLLCARYGALEAGAAVPDAAASGGVPEARPMYFEHLTMRDGLSQSTVMSILQDSQGYLWLGTESGLNRYDGYSVHEYRRARGNEQGLASDYVWSLAGGSPRRPVACDVRVVASRAGIARPIGSSASGTILPIRIPCRAISFARC